MKSNLFSLVFLFCAACSGYSVTGGPGETVAPSLQSSVRRYQDLRSLNVMMLTPVVIDERIRRQAEALAPAVNGKLEDVVRREVDLDVVAASPEPQMVRSGISPVGGWLKKAKAAGADAILVTRLQTYREREGSAVGAEQGAKVAFNMSVFRVGDGEELWRATYYYEDVALAENVFRLAERDERFEGNGWLSANRILLRGFEEAMQDLTRQRAAAFSGEKQ